MPDKVITTEAELKDMLAAKKTENEAEFRKKYGLDKPGKELPGDERTEESEAEVSFSGIARAMVALKMGRAGEKESLLLSRLTYDGADKAFVMPKYIRSMFVPETPAEQMAHALKGLRVQKTGMAESAGATGGALVPIQFIPQLQMLPLEAVNLRSFCQVFPVGSPTVRIPAINDTTHAGGTVFGGVQAYYEGEASTLTGTQPTFASIELTSRKLTIYTPVTNELLADSPISIDALVGELTRQAMAWKENQKIIRGSGVGEPLGFLNSAALVTITKETGQAAATIVYENVNKMWASMWPAYRAGSVWVINPECSPQLEQMSLTIGTAGAAAFMPAGGISGAPFDTLKGRPIIYSEHASALGTAGDISIVNLKQFLWADRQQMTMSVSEHVLFASDQTAFKLIERHDAKPWLLSALTPANGSLTYSAFVTLGARA